jgi:hypothetical protein
MSAEKAETLRLWEEENKKSSFMMIELTQRTADAMQENFSNVFYDQMKGKLSSFKDYFTSFLDSMQRAWADIMGQMMTQWIFGQDMKGGGMLSQAWNFISGALGGMSTGGSGGSTIRGGQGGGYGFDSGGHIGEPVRGFGMSSGKSYEFHPNETVIPDKKLGGGGGGVNNITVYNITANDAASFVELARRSGAVPLLAAENLADNGSLRKAIMENL